MLDHDYRGSFHNHEHLWADTHTELIFTSGEPYFRLVPRQNLPASFVIGPFQSELELHSRGRTTLVAARFWPWGFHSLSNVPMTDLKNTVQSCRRTLGRYGQLLERELAAADGVDARISKLQHSLSRALEGSDHTRLHSRPMAADILKARGMIRVSDLSRQHGIHTRQLQRIFLDEIGVTAKVLSRIVRFNSAKKMIETNPNVDLLNLTYECGYSDQAHFSRNFREMFGITPTDFKSQMKKAFEHFREKKPDVVFIQDDEPEAD